MRIRYAAACLLALLVHAADLRAEVEPKLDKARHLANLLRLDAQVEYLIPLLMENYLGILRHSFETYGRLDNTEEDLMEVVHALFMETALSNTHLFVNKLAHVYASEFSLDELDVLLWIYQHPVMQKMLDRTAVLMEAGRIAGEEWGLEIADIAIQNLLNQR